MTELSRRRLLLGGAALGGGLLSVSACSSGSGSASGGASEITALISKDAQNSQSQSEWLAFVAKQFNKQHPKVKVNWTTYSSSNEELRKLQTGVATHTGPDVFNFGGTVLPTAYATGGIRTLTAADWKLLGGQDSLLAKPRAMGGPDADTIIGVPYAMRPFAMLHNTELLEKAGISEVPKSWDDFVTAARKITDASSGVYGTGMSLADSYQPWKIVWMLTRQAGGRFISEDLKTAQLDTPEVRDAFLFWFSWLTKFKIVDPHSLTYKGADVTKAFAAGKLGMQLMTNATILPTLDDSSVKGKYAFSSHPVIPYGMDKIPPGGEPVTAFTSGDMMTVTKSSEAPDLAYSLIGAMVGYDSQLKLHEATGNLPTNAKAAAHIASKSPIDKAFVEGEKKSTRLPFTGAWGAIETAIASVTSNLANRVSSNGKVSKSDVETELSKANTNAQAAIR